MRLALTLILAAIGVVLLVGGVWLIALGGSWYYAIAGLAGGHGSTGTQAGDYVIAYALPR